MADLDQGGVARTKFRKYMGPSIGWIDSASDGSAFPISAGGTYNIDLSITYVPVNTTGAVILVLPSALNPVAGVGAVPGPFADTPIVIADVGGNAQAHPITIQPSAGDTIMGLASIQITVNYGGYTLAPNSATRTWNSISP